MKVLVTGATGLIGQALSEKLLARGDSVIGVGRNKNKIEEMFSGKVKAVSWDIYNPDSNRNNDLKSIISEVDSVVNLAGENIASQRWSEDFKKRILSSRVKSNELLVKFIMDSQSKTKTFVGASAVGYYGIADDKEFIESDAPGNDFMAEVCVKWEESSKTLSDVDRLIVRIGVVLSTNGGALKKMLLPFKLFVGGPLGNGKQWFPWIHIDDLTDIIIDGIDGKRKETVNAVAPGIVSMNEFCKVLGKQMHRPSLFNVPKIVLKILFGEGADYLAEGAKIKPARLIEAGYKYKYANISEALKNLIE